MARLNIAVLVCFSANNLINIAKELTGKAYVFADNDISNVGKTSAEKTGLAYVMSDVVGDDANDLHRKSGLIAVLKKVMEVRSKK
jgi:putative DNA primase/helicase